MSYLDSTKKPLKAAPIDQDGDENIPKATHRWPTSTRQVYQSGPSGLSSAGSVAFHQVSELMFSLTVRALPSAMAAWIAVGSMADCQSAK